MSTKRLSDFSTCALYASTQYAASGKTGLSGCQKHPICYKEAILNSDFIMFLSNLSCQVISFFLFLVLIAYCLYLFSF